MEKGDQEEKEINARFFRNFIDKTEEDEKESTEDDDPFSTAFPYYPNTTQSSPDEGEDKEQPNIELFIPSFEEKNKNNSKIFKVVYPKKDFVFTCIDNGLFTEEEILCRKRYPKKRRRRENQDNIRKKIKRGFFNKALLQKLNMILINKGSKSYFEKFQQHFVSNVTRKTNNALMNMTLEEIFEEKGLYQVNELKYYEHNLNLVKSKEIQDNIELKNILNKKLYLIFEEYTNSKEFLIDEINRLKDKNMDNGYIERYKYLAKHFIEFAMD